MLPGQLQNRTGLPRGAVSPAAPLPLSNASHSPYCVIMEKHKTSRVNTAAAVGAGLALGVAMGLTTGNIALGVAFGVLFAVALGKSASRKDAGKIE